MLGIVVAALSLIVMPVLAWRKQRTSKALQRPALLADAKERSVCAYLSFTLLLGLLLRALVGWWWADPAAALAMVPFVLREGWETVREAGEAGTGSSARAASAGRCPA